MSIALSREPGRRRASTPISHFALRRLLDAVGHPPIIFVLWDGAEIGAEQGAVARVHVRGPRALWSMLRNPSVGFGDAYADGQLVVEGDLAHTLEVVFRASQH